MSSYDVIPLETLVNAIAEVFFCEVLTFLDLRNRIDCADPMLIDDALLCHFDLHVTELLRYFFFY